MFFNQTFAVSDLGRIAILIVLEAVLSIDNALVLGLLARRLPVSQRAKALTLGLVGAFVFRFISIAVAQKLLTYTIVKLLGGLYLFYVAMKYFWDNLRAGKGEAKASEESTVSVAQGVERAGASLGTADGVTIAADNSTAAEASGRNTVVYGFWSTVFVIELTDIAFAVDSIVAAIGLVGAVPDPNNWHPKLWVVVLGGFIGVILMRYAATVFIRLLELFPRFEVAAYLLVAVIGGKLTLDWWFNPPGQPHKLDFHNVTSVAFWAFWLLMLLCFCVGFIPKKSEETPRANA